MKKTQVIVPASEIKAWDVIGINTIPSRQATTIRISSGTNIEDFKASDESPRMRALVLAVIRNVRAKDAVDGFLLLPMAPHEPTKHLENGQKNLMLSNKTRERKAALEGMGLDPRLQWRINHTPFPLSLGIPLGHADDKVTKFGSASAELIQALRKHIPNLGPILATAGVLEGADLRRSLNEREKNFEGVEVGVRQSGNKRDTEAAMRIRQNEVDAARQEQDAERLRAEKEMRMAVRATPSGRLAIKCQLSFAEAAKRPDIALEDAYQQDILSESDEVELAIIGEELDAPTLRTIYDEFVQNHERTVGVMEQLGYGEDSASEKGRLETALKSALTDFFKTLGGPPTDQKTAMERAITPYAAKPNGPAV